MNVTVSYFVTNAALNLVRSERHAQDKKWGSQRQLPNDTWNRILVEEVGEVSKALNDKESTEALKAELVQVAAVATAWVEALTTLHPDDEATFS